MPKRWARPIARPFNGGWTDQRPSGTIVIIEEEEAHVRRPERVVIYAHVSSHKQAPGLDWQVQRLLDYCAAKGYQVARSVKEIGPGLVEKLDLYEEWGAKLYGQRRARIKAEAILKQVEET